LENGNIPRRTPLHSAVTEAMDISPVMDGQIARHHYQSAVRILVLLFSLYKTSGTFIP